MRYKTTGIVAVLLLTAMQGCRRAPPAWTPVLEQTSTDFLRVSTSRNIDRVSAARRHLASDPDMAERLLETAERELVLLREVYLPLFDARGDAFNAYRFYHLDRHADAARELEDIEQTILRVSRSADSRLLPELERLEQLVGNARIELQAESPRAERALRHLAETLGDFVQKGDLFL